MWVVRTRPCQNGRLLLKFSAKQPPASKRPFFTQISGCPFDNHRSFKRALRTSSNPLFAHANFARRVPCLAAKRTRAPGSKENASKMRHHAIPYAPWFGPFWARYSRLCAFFLMINTMVICHNMKGRWSRSWDEFCCAIYRIEQVKMHRPARRFDDGERNQQVRRAAGREGRWVVSLYAGTPLSIISLR